MVQRIAAPADRPPLTGPTAGLRQRKKQRTRDDLVRAAEQLFLLQGYARTTVDEIASAVEVSQRTFFRYFANKEQVALALVADSADDFIEHLHARPADENPLQALRAAMRETWQSRGADKHQSASTKATLEIFQLIDGTPTLLAAHLRRLAEQEQQIAAILAEREGLDPAADLRPRLLAALFGAVARTAQQQWTATAVRDSDPEDFMLVLECHLDQLGPALATDWH